MSLSIEEFRSLSRVEKERRYIELSAHDKFIARMEDVGTTDEPVISAEDFLKHPPKGWEALTQEVFETMFPNNDKTTRP